MDAGDETEPLAMGPMDTGQLHREDDPDPCWLNGKLLDGRYLVEREIGHGGMAAIYLAHDGRLFGQETAIKALLPKWRSDETIARRFEIEARALVALDNDPHIVNVSDYGEDHGIRYIAMEYVQGESLKERLHEVGHLTQGQVLRLTMQVAQALRLAHSRHVVHLDIKPGNVLISGGVAKLVDFGVAVMDPYGVPLEDGRVCGSLGFMAPEQFMRGELGPVGPWTDVYALGVTLYLAMTGRMPFDGPDVRTVWEHQLHQTPLAPHELVSGLDPIFEAIVLRCMAREPQNRYRSGAELLDALLRQV